MFVGIATSLHFIHDHKQSVQYNILERDYDKTYTIKLTVKTFKSFDSCERLCYQSDLMYFLTFVSKAPPRPQISMPINSRRPLYTLSISV